MAADIHKRWTEGWGSVNPSYQARGARASITVRNAPFCTPNTGQRTTAWSLLSGGDPLEFAQIGYQWSASSPLRFFYEWQKNLQSTFVKVIWGDPGVGTSYDFKVDRWLGDGHIHMQLNGDNPPCKQGNCTLGQPETDFDPLAQGSGWTNMQDQWFAEVVDRGSDVPGTSSAKAEFDATKIRDTSETWVTVLSDSYNVVADPTCSYYHEDVTLGSGHFDVWTSTHTAC